MLRAGKCWGLGANAVGYSFAKDRARCDLCNRKAFTVLWFEIDRALCDKCAIARHLNCPCLVA